MKPRIRATPPCSAEAPRETGAIGDALRRLVPFGLASRKPRHFRDMARVAWENRDNLGYAWKVLSRGVCDGCALGVSGFRDWTIDGVHLCTTRLNLLRLNTAPPFDPALLADASRFAGASNEELRRLGRLAHPMIRERGDRGFRRIGWDEAIGRVARRIRGSHPDRTAFFLTSRGLTNEVYYVAQKAARLIGTNNVDNAARLCHSPSTGAMKHALGVAASTCSYSDWMKADLIVFFGSNPANDQPVSTKYLVEARAKGARVALVNPYFEPGMRRYWVPSTPSSAVFGTDLTDWWYPVAQGGDIAFLYGVLKTIVERGWTDRAFVEAHTTGFAAIAERARAMDMADLSARCGIPASGIVEFAERLRDARNAVFVWSMGITQHAFGGDAVSMILNVGLARGYVGRDGCGMMPIRGHSGVQGGAETGAYATAFPGGKPIDEAGARELAAIYGFPVPATPGLPAPEMVEAAARGELDVLYCVGGNFLRTLPQPERVRAALGAVPTRVHQDLILTDQCFVEPKEEVLLLPARTRYEQEGGGTETTTERRILFSPEIPREVGEARSEWRILRDVALAVRPEAGAVFGCDSGPAIREEIARVVPFYDGIQNLAKEGDQFQYGGPHLCAGGVCPTPDGRARFRVVDVPDGRREPGTFVASTRRGKQFNTLIYAEIDPLNGAPRDAALMNPDDAAELGLKKGDRVALVSDAGRLDVRVHPAPIARGNLQVHWPEGNVLIAAGRVDSLGGVPDYNARVRVEPPR